MRLARSGLVAAGLAFLSAASAQAGTYVYTLVGSAGSTQVHLGPINDAGVVAGSIGSQGMIWRAGVATPFGAPAGTTFVDAVAITRYGIVLAHDTGAGGAPGTYTYDSVKGTYRQLAVPGLATLHGVWISGNGDVVGSGTMVSGSGTHAFGVFDRVGMILEPPRAVASSARLIQDDGTVVGSATIGGRTLGFYYRNGAYKVLAPPGASASTVELVEPDGTVVGDFTAGAASGPYVYRHGVYTIVGPPGAISVTGGASKDGTVVGSFTTSTGDTDGFTYKDGVYTVLVEPEAFGFGNPTLTRALFVDHHGDVFGYYDSFGYITFEYKNGVYTNGSIEGNFPGRTLSDGRLFGTGWISHNPGIYVGSATAMGYLFLPNSYANYLGSVNSHGEFTGTAQLVPTQYYQEFIATCPADQMPCDRAPGS